jgi:hypothetical protein
MSDTKPMPRQVVMFAGGLIVLSAVAGLAFGALPSLKGHGPDADSGDVVAPIKTVANATPLVAPPVTEADVRRWAREEMAAQRAAAPKKPKVDTDPAADDAVPTDAAAPSGPTSPTAAKPPAAAPVQPKPAASQPIPF